MHAQSTRHKLFRFVIAILTIAMLLAACNPAPTPAPPETTQAGGSAVTEPPAAGEKEVFWFHSTNETETRRPAVEKFFKENYPNMEVKFEVTPEGYFEKVLSQIASGDVPDMIYMHESQILNFAHQGALMPIDDFMASKPLIGDPNQYPIDVFKRDVSYKGKLYGLPMGFAVLMLRYNKNMFEEAGVTPPNADWTWENFREAAAKLTKDTNGDGKPDQWGWVGWWPDWLPSWWSVLRSYGGRHFNDDISASAMTEPGSIAALDFMRSVWCGDLRGSPSPAVNAQLDSGTVPVFEGGVAAMDYILSQNVNNALEAIDDKFEMGIELFPTGPDGRFLRAGGTSYAIPTGSKHPEIAWELIRYLAGDEEAGKLAAEYENGNPLIRLDLVLKYNAPQGPLVEDWKRIVTDGFEKYGTVVQYAPIGEYGDIVNASMEKLGACEITAQESAQEIAEATNQALEDIK